MDCLSKCCNAEAFTSKLFNRCIRCGKNLEEREIIFPSPPSFKEKRGKVIFATIHNRNSIPGADKLLLAVGKPKGTTYFKWFLHDPGLAPSRELVTFTKEHNRKGKQEGWFERYTESLLEEWMKREDSMKSLVRLRKWLDQGLNVGIACYCDSAKREFCHLSILQDILSDMGYETEEAEPIRYK